jgi:chemotaxis signal transduction protein
METEDQMIDQFEISESLTGLVIFEISRKEFCANIKDVSAIVNPRDLPQSKRLENDDIAIKVNELNVHMIDLHKIFDIKQIQVTKDERIILVEIEEKIFGFYVEKVKEILTMSKGFRSKIIFSPNNENQYLLGKLNYGTRQLFMPDFSKIAMEVL